MKILSLRKSPLWFISLLLADMWRCYGLLLAQIWQTGAVHPSAIIPCHMWARSSFQMCPDVGRIWADIMLLSGIGLPLLVILNGEERGYYHINILFPTRPKKSTLKLHKIYPVNATVSKYIDISSTCSFCGDEDETLVHLFYPCNLVQKFWSSVFSHLNKTPIHAYSFNLKDIICYYTDSHTSKEYIFNFFILFGKFFIHKQKFMGSFPIFSHFLVEVDSMLKSFSLTSNKKCDRFLKIYEQLFCNGSDIQD